MAEEAPAPKPVTKDMGMSVVEVGLKCPECGSLGPFYKDGLRYLNDGSTVQRWLCRECGYRFSEDFKNKLKANRKSDAHGKKALVMEAEEKASTTDGLAGATTTDIKGLIIQHAWWLKKQGAAEQTIQNYTYKLKLLVEAGADLANPDSVKDTLARLNKSNVWKHLAVCAYTSLLKMLGKKWEPPNYKIARKIPFIPTEQELDMLITSSSKKMAAFLQVLKETGMRAGEAQTLEWTDIDFERNLIRLNMPEKGGNARIFKISSKLACMLGALPKDSAQVFGSTTLKTKQRVFELTRLRAANKLGNPRLLNITFHTFRHWRASMEYHRTRDIIHVQQMLGHKNLDTTTLYIQIEKALFQTDNDEFHFATAKTVEEAGRLITQGFEYVCHHDGLMMFRKRK